VGDGPDGPALLPAGTETFDRLVHARDDALRELVLDWSADGDPEVERVIEGIARELDVPAPAR
jgi:hypothetical protein